MLLFQKRFHEGLVSGSVTLTFRRWPRARVRAGGRYRCHPIGVLEVDEVSLVLLADITESDARKSGFARRDELIAYMMSASEEPLTSSSSVWRIALHHGGDGDRVALALEEQVSVAEVQLLTAQLERFDTKGPKPWTQDTLAIIGERPRVAASKLAAALGRETKPFKADVVKLKKLGLTQSFEVGYEISARGRAYLTAMASSPQPRTSYAPQPAAAGGLRRPDGQPGTRSPACRHPATPAESRRAYACDPASATSSARP